MKNNHEIILKQYAAYCKEQPLYLGTAGSYGMEMLTIIREGVWAEYDILAAFHPPVGAAVQVRVGANNQIDVPIEATAGEGMGEIVFAGYKEGVRQIAVDVLYKVAPSSGASGTEPAEPTPDVVQQILSAANGAVKTADGVREDMDKVLEAESGRETAEANRAAAESARVEAETARVDAEAYRAAAEKERQTAESAHLAAENDRQSAETARAKAETARESAETDRATAEVARVNAEEERADYEKLRKDHETQRVTDETARQTAESKRQEAETARADAESKRAAAEQARVKAESTRVAAETTRKGAESKRDNAEQERQTAEKGRVAAEAKRTEDFAKIKERLDEIPKIDDTAITTTSPWSSKNIVDMLCPPLEESGNPVVCYPVAGYPLGMKAKWEPVQEGSGTPSPENIRPIKGRDSVTITRQEDNQVITLTLPETVYGGEVDAVTGDAKETWKTLTLDGTGKWETQTTAIPGKFGFTLQVPGIATPENPGIKGDIVCSQYPAVTANDTYQCENGISVEAQENHYFRIYNDTHAGETADEWKSYLAAQYAAGTPVQICYKLKESVPFTAAGAQPIPALSGTNTLLTDADSVSVSGRADLIHIIKKIQEK